MKNIENDFGEVFHWADNELFKIYRYNLRFSFTSCQTTVEMNKRKNDEIKGFLKWFEREINAEIDSLTNKTAIKEYYEHDFNHLLEILRKNRNKISIDPSDRKKQEMLEKQFIKSLSILEPLKAGIKATDELIDEIVYRLYGLTEEEIKIIKGTKSI